jgi:tetratricopeptide (TPR) repeat protein
MFRWKEKDAVDVGGADDLVSPLQGDSLLKIAVKVAVAIAIPGGLYVLAALVIAPVVARFFLKRADKRAATGDLDKALASANRAAFIGRRSADVHARRAAIHLERADLDAALADAARALDRNEDHALAHFVRAAALDQQGQLPEAAASYRRFLEHSTDDLERASHARQRVSALENGSSA